MDWLRLAEKELLASGIRSPRVTVRTRDYESGWWLQLSGIRPATGCRVTTEEMLPTGALSTEVEEKTWAAAKAKTSRPSGWRTERGE